MEWISFFDRQPEDGQGIWYYGQHIGVWAGEYRYCPTDKYSHHIMHCHESPIFPATPQYTRQSNKPFGR